MLSPIKRSTAALVTLLATAAIPSLGAAQGVDLPTTCTPQAEDAIDEGLSLLHNMMYIEAETAFNRAVVTDPDCAMAQWGISMANFHPLWPGSPTEGETTRGTAAAKRLADMTPGNALEQAFAEAATAFYSPEHTGYRARLSAWAAAQDDAYTQNPDNIDAGALAALGRLATAPGGPGRFEVNAAVGDLLDSLHEDAPNHPGVIHYAIHAYDNPPLKNRGLPYAEIYDKAAPDAAHALHMPAHIFTRTGDWAASIDLNRRSAEAALKHSGDIVQTHYVHAIDYMVYAYLQIGQPEKAAALVEEMLAMDNHQASFGGAYGLAASPVRLLLEQDKWAEAGALSPDMHSSIPWEKFPQTVAMRWFAKGLGAARSNDVETARSAVEELRALLKKMQEGGQDYWAKLTEGQILSVEAWIELAEGNDELAVTHQTKAAVLEDEIGKSPVTPGHVLPARELLGDILRAVGQPNEAADAYRATLAHSPNRARSLSALN
jgi:tetratricopeptide (TPR) repeat protein